MIRKLAFALGLSAALLLPAPAPAQVQDNITAAAVITNTAAVPGTVTVVGPRNTSSKGVFCVFQQVSESGNPSTVISVEAQDVTSGQWQAIGAATAVTTSTAAPGISTLEIYPGIQTASLPSGVVGVGLKLPAVWRLKQVITGGTSTTGSASCDLLN
jgi:hypothetical protein